MIDPEQIVHLNGALLPIADAKISVLDRGFIYGDGAYELVPVYRGQPFRMPQHLTRLQRTSTRSGSRTRTPSARMGAAHRRADRAAAVRGPGRVSADHARRGEARPCVPEGRRADGVPDEQSAADADARAGGERGVAVVTAEDNRWKRCDLKTISLLGNVLMRQLATDADAVETVMFRDGWLTEASSSNVLVVKDGGIIAPPKDNQILPGITYDAAIEFARDAGLVVDMRPVAKAEALGADEMWLSSSTKEVLAVTTVDGVPFGGGTPGPVFRRMCDAFQARKPASAPPRRIVALSRPTRPVDTVAAAGERRDAAKPPWWEDEPVAARALNGHDLADEERCDRRLLPREMAAFEPRDAPSISGASAQPSRCGTPEKRSAWGREKRRASAAWSAASTLIA